MAVVAGKNRNRAALLDKTGESRRYWPLKTESSMKVCNDCGTSHPDEQRFCEQGHVLFLEASDDVLIGRVLDDRYEVAARLGEGGFGMVYLAAQMKLEGRPCVVKVAKPELARDVEFAARFEREKKALMALRGRNTVQILDYGRTEDGIDYIVMEYIEGEGLDEVLKRERRLTPARALRIAVGVCLSLEEAHKAGILHRDLKPSNVMLVDLGPAELVKVIDFGIARLVSGNEGTFRTATGDMPGTPMYASYEQLAGQTHVIDERTDVYSLGAMLYEMLSGVPPYGDAVRPRDFDSTTLYFLALVRAKLEGPPVPCGQVYPGAGASPGLERYLQCMLEKSASARPASAREVREALENLGGLSPVASDTTPDALAMTAADTARYVEDKPGIGLADTLESGGLVDGATVPYEAPEASQDSSESAAVESPAGGGMNRLLAIAGGSALLLLLVVFGVYFASGLGGKAEVEQDAGVRPVDLVVSEEVKDIAELSAAPAAAVAEAGAPPPPREVVPAPPDVVEEATTVDVPRDRNKEPEVVSPAEPEVKTPEAAKQNRTPTAKQDRTPTAREGPAPAKRTEEPRPKEPEEGTGGTAAVPVTEKPPVEPEPKPEPEPPKPEPKVEDSPHQNWGFEDDDDDED